MPKKNIYVKDKDLEIFDTAERIGGESVSNIIAEALTLYIKEKKIHIHGFEKVVINEGIKDGETVKLKKLYFFGKYLSGYEDVNEENIYFNISLYETIKDKILIYENNYDIGKKIDLYRHYIYDNIEDTVEKHNIPKEIYKEAVNALENEGIEFLDV